MKHLDFAALGLAAFLTTSSCGKESLDVGIDFDPYTVECSEVENIRTTEKRDFYDRTKCKSGEKSVSIDGLYKNLPQAAGKEASIRAGIENAIQCLLRPLDKVNIRSAIYQSQSNGTNPWSVFFGGKKGSNIQGITRFNKNRIYILDQDSYDANDKILFHDGTSVTMDIFQNNIGYPVHATPGTLVNTTTHEIGHALGLKHPKEHEAKSIMGGDLWFFSPNEAKYLCDRYSTLQGAAGFQQCRDALVNNTTRCATEIAEITTQSNELFANEHNILESHGGIKKFVSGKK